VSQVKQAKRVPVDSAKVEPVFGRKGLGAADDLVDIDVAVPVIGAGEDRRDNSATGASDLEPELEKIKGSSSRTCWGHSRDL
jgi:hypothetical protein